MQRVEGGVAQQVEGERQPVGRRASAATGRRDRADLAGPDAEPTGVERAAERQPDLRVAVPAEVDDRALRREQVERALQPGGRRAGVDDQIATVGGVGRQREVDTERGRDVGAAGVDVDERHLHRREPASSRATQQPTMPAPTTVTRSPSSGAASHSALTAVSTVPASTARAGGTSSGTTTTASAGTTYAVWCG